jgi:hypothetical protein
MLLLEDDSKRRSTGGTDAALVLAKESMEETAKLLEEILV